MVLQDQVLTVKARDCSDNFMYTSTIIKVMQDQINLTSKLSLDRNYKKKDALAIQLQVKAMELNSFYIYM